MRSRRSLGRVGLRGEHLARGVIHHGPGLPRSGISAIREEHDIIPYAVSGRRPHPLREMTWRVWSSAGYCIRDDVVFLPDGTYAAPGQARSMMYNSACQMLSPQSYSA